MSDESDSALYAQLSNFLSSNQYDRARDVAGHLLAQEPDSAWLHYIMGLTNYHLGEYKESEAFYKKAIGLEPDDDDNYQGLAWTISPWGVPVRRMIISGKRFP